MTNYTVTVGCQNCNFNQDIDLPKGQVVTDAKCPQCGCVTLHPVISKKKRPSFK